ncbi:MAG: hypothetical protein KBD14_02805, partial [Candidatus Pacebacteria bacterium]|nr:hypothetical protein [Candidatus Paceibacterota bacterium]
TRAESRQTALSASEVGRRKYVFLARKTTESGSGNFVFDEKQNIVAHHQQLARVVYKNNFKRLFGYIIKL